MQPTYPRGVRAAELGGLLGEELAGALRAGLRAFGRRLPGYTAPEAVLTGLETRTSSPVRLARGEGLESPELPGVYPCGEGAVSYTHLDVYKRQQNRRVKQKTARNAAPVFKTGAAAFAVKNGPLCRRTGREKRHLLQAP